MKNLLTARSAAYKNHPALAGLLPLLIVCSLLILIGCKTASKETAGACDAPDATYPQLTYDTWNNLNYALPWCWTSNEVIDKTGASTLLRLDHGEGELSLDITITANQGDPGSMWGPPENLYGEYYYYDFLINDSTSEFMRFENGTKISVITQNPIPETARQNLYNILSSLSLQR